MKTFRIILFVVIAGAFTACDEDGYFDNGKRVTGTGEIESVSVGVIDFSSVNLENVSNVYVETGLACKVVFTAYENILPYMEAKFIGDELVLKFNRDINVNSDEEIRVDITLPELDKITLSGAGNFYINGPQQEELELELNGVGNIEAFGLRVINGYVELNGTGNIQIDAKEYLSVDIDGLGNVYYKGDPELALDINGLGEVVAED